jgi:hypothetical protein
MASNAAEILGYRMLLKRYKTLLDKAARGEVEYEGGERILHAHCFFCGGRTLLNGCLREEHKPDCDYAEVTALYKTIQEAHHA